jgi:hypothetical protein
MRPTYVTFEQAKLLKEKEFNEKCVQGYNKSEKYLGELIVDFPNRNTDNIVISAPEQWQVIEWLRINHGIWVQVSYYYEDKIENWYNIIHIKKDDIETQTDCFSSPQEAYSAAITHCLEKII